MVCLKRLTQQASVSPDTPVKQHSQRTSWRVRQLRRGASLSRVCPHGDSMLIRRSTLASTCWFCSTRTSSSPCIAGGHPSLAATM